MALIGFDPSTLLSYYAAKQPLNLGTTAARSSVAAKPLPPWDIRNKPPAQENLDRSARSLEPYFDPKDRSLFAAPGNTGANAGSLLESIVNKSLSGKAGVTDDLSSDNHKLFGLYQALYRLDHIAKMANRDGITGGQRPGLDASFQAGLKQILDFVDVAAFSKLTLMSGARSASTQSDATIPYSPFNYTGKTVARGDGLSAPVPGVSASDKFTVNITKGGVTTGVDIDLANISGPLTVDAINSYVNTQLSAAGFATRFARVQTGGEVLKNTATWGIKISNAASEAVSLSSTEAETALYVAGQAGATGNQEGRLLKLTDLAGPPTSVYSNSIVAENGTSSAKATAVDASGNVYVVGGATGDFGSQLNQGSEDAYLRKYDSAGQLQWSRLLGAADKSTGYAVAIGPNGSVVVAGSVTGDLTPTAIGSGKDSFVAKYDSQGNQTWLRQVAPGGNDDALSVSIDATGNIYVGGQLNGTLGGNTSVGGQDAYVTKLSSEGKLIYNRQFGTAGIDSASHTAIADDGNLLVASIENGHAILTKYAAADGTAPAMWRMDMGDLQGGALGGIAVSGGAVYVSGTTSNAALNAGGSATIAEASNGGVEAFVFKANDSGASASADFVSYVGTSESEQAGGVAITGGNIYLTGTTTGTFAGMNRVSTGTHNTFVAALDGSGNSLWTQQYGGTGGQSKGFAIAADTQGASVLDALGLPRGKIELNQSSAIVTQTTARAGDYFTLKITGPSGERNFKVTLAKGDTLRSLAVKINAYLMFDGKATATPASGGQKLKIEAKEGRQIELIAGKDELDLLAGLGLKEQILIKDAPKDDKTAAKDADAKPLIGLALLGKLDLLTKTDANHAHVVMQAAMAQIKQVYSTLNDPPAASSSLGPVSGIMAAKLQSYQTALAVFGQ